MFTAPGEQEEPLPLLPNINYVEMLDAVVAVVEESLRRGEPFEAWLD